MGRHTAPGGHRASLRWGRGHPLTRAGPRVALVAGEVSGDRLGSALMLALRSHRPDIEFRGIGGAGMQAAGLVPSGDFNRLQVNGLLDPVMRLAELWRLLRSTGDALLDWRPDVFVGVDFNVFNSLLERRMHAAGVAVAHYVSPSVYAWRRGRARSLASYTDLLLTLFPFDADYYRGLPIKVVFTGHPVTEALAEIPAREAARAHLGVPPGGTVILVLPGSRPAELQRMLLPLVAAARRLRPAAILIGASGVVQRDRIKTVLASTAMTDTPWTVTTETHTAIAAADGVLAKAGTVTLEVLLIGRPMVIAYRTDRLTELAFRLLALTPWVGLPNILTGESLVPELLQNAASPAALAATLEREMNEFEPTGKAERFARIAATLAAPGPAASATAAAAVLELLER